MLSDGPPRRLRVVRVSKILASPLANRLGNGVRVFTSVVGQVERRVDVFFVSGPEAVSAAIIAIDFITSRVRRHLQNLRVFVKIIDFRVEDFLREGF